MRQEANAQPYCHLLSGGQGRQSSVHWLLTFLSGSVVMMALISETESKALRVRLRCMQDPRP